jgi:CheY-like chemotaxis protein
LTYIVVRQKYSNEISSHYLEKQTYSMRLDKDQYDYLVIEHDLAIIRLLTSFFESKGLKGKSVINGLMGLEELKKGLPRIILLDLTLPDLYWLNIIQIIKADETLRDIPLFLFGKLSKTGMIEKIEELGIIATIPKPVHFEDFELFLKYASKTFVIDDITLWDDDDDT